MGAAEVERPARTQVRTHLGVALEEPEAMKQFVWGLLAMASLVAGIFFLRYWKDSGERLFVFFAVAFGLIIGGIVDKNRALR